MKRSVAAAEEAVRGTKRHDPLLIPYIEIRMEPFDQACRASAASWYRLVAERPTCGHGGW